MGEEYLRKCTECMKMCCLRGKNPVCLVLNSPRKILMAYGSSCMMAFAVIGCNW